MCGICFICTLSRQPLADDVQTSVLGSSSIKTSDDSSADLLFNGIVQQQTVASHTQEHEEKMVNALFTDPLLHHRGPDVSTKHTFPLTESLNGYMLGCVLHLRGEITPQPVKDATGNALLWNGEIFDGIQVDEQENDTQVLFSHLVSSITEKDILKTMQKIHGPWAFIFWQADAQKLWFGRDMFGRRSLLWHLPFSNSDPLILSSVALGEMDFTEIPSVGIFCLDFSKSFMSGPNALCPLLTLYPWKRCYWPGTSVAVVGTNKADVLEYLYPKLSSCLPVCIDTMEVLDSWIEDLNRCLPDSDECLLPPLCSLEGANSACLEEILMHILENRCDLDALAEKLINVLQMSVDKRVNNLPRKYCLCQNCLRPHGEELNSCGLSATIGLQEPALSGLESEISKIQLSGCTGRNVTSHANVGILFSGGLDSTILAALADRCVPEGETIDLLNVAFEQPVLKSANNKKPKEYQKARKRAKRGKNIPASEQGDSARNLSDVKSTHSDEREVEFHYDELISHSKTEPHMSLGSWMNESSVTDQFVDISLRSGVPDRSSVSNKVSSALVNDMSDHSCVTNEVSISSALLNNMSDHSCVTNEVSISSALLSNDMSDHSCVTRENSISSTLVGDTSNLIDNNIPNGIYSGTFEVPDRQTGMIALSELNPKRKWNFVEINVTQAELQALRKSHIRRLIYPSQTVLDDSIGCAVWFAARGSGVLSDDKRQKFVSTARVVLCGMAADEQFCGYSRHRVTFKTKGWEGLLREIQEEMWRISARNLGRDDRTITDHGKECRFPFLDETFTQMVSSIPVHKRADLRLPRGVGDKLLLRLCALKLGLVKTAAQPKRAIQFGSKIAKLDQRKEKGSDICDRLN